MRFFHLSAGIAILVLLSGCGEEVVVALVPPEGVDWIATLALRDIASAPEPENVGLISPLRRVEEGIELDAEPLVLVGFSQSQIERSGNPPLELIEQDPLRFLKELDAQVSLPDPTWQVTLSAEGQVDPLDFELAPMTAAWLPRFTWQEVTTSSTPSPRHSNRLTYDPDEELLYLTGSASGRSESWTFDGDWRKTGEFGSLGFLDHGSAYDERRGVLVIFGGGSACASDETWELEAGVWRERTFEVAPSPRCGPAMAYDSNRQVVLLFGGGQGKDETTGLSIRFADTWAYDGESWTLLEDWDGLHGPEPRNNHKMVFDASRQAMVMTGGEGPSTLETWIYEESGWKALEPEVAPPARSKHGMVYVDALESVIIFGGWKGPAEFDDTWLLDRRGWRKLPILGPSQRCNLMMAHDVRRARTVLFGGIDATRGGIAVNDTWELFPSSPSD